MEWKDQIWEYPRRYALRQNADNTVDIIPARGRSIQAGTPINAENLNKLLPKGLISMWSGSITSIPEGWVLCDGNNGTPDLRNRFIVGAGGEYSVGNKGGIKEVTLTEAQMPRHSHSGSTSSAGSHSHNLRERGGWGGGDYDTLDFVEREDYNIKSGVVMSAGSHSHSVSIGHAGSGQSHENRPPYFALAFIMKL